MRLSGGRLRRVTTGRIDLDDDKKVLLAPLLRLQFIPCRNGGPMCAVII
jgi:hypothetical protein